VTVEEILLKFVNSYSPSCKRKWAQILFTTTQSFLGLKNIEPQTKKITGYCRVISPKQKDDWIRQIDNVKTYMLVKSYRFEIIQDIGSGMNYNKKGLN